MSQRAALYGRVSTFDQTTANQLLDLRQMARQRGLEIIKEYVDHGISGTRTRRPGLDRMMVDARHGQFDILLVWACDRMARSTKHFLEVLDELNRLNIEFASFRENLDTGGPLGRAFVVIISAIAELERSLIVERVRAVLRRAKLEGRRIGRTPLQIDHAALVRDRERGMILNQLAKVHGISKASVCRFLRQLKPTVSETLLPNASAATDNKALRLPFPAA